MLTSRFISRFIDTFLFIEDDLSSRLLLNYPISCFTHCFFSFRTASITTIDIENNTFCTTIYGEPASKANSRSL